MTRLVFLFHVTCSHVSADTAPIFAVQQAPFFCHSFSRALHRANSCVRQLRGFCFPGSALTRLGSLPPPPLPFALPPRPSLHARPPCLCSTPARRGGCS